MNLHPPENSRPVPASDAIGAQGWIMYRRGYAKKSVIWRKYMLDQPCLAIRTTPQGWKPYIDGRQRKLSADELKQLHSYGCGFSMTGSHSLIWKQIGNSVPPLMMRAIARHLRSVLEEII